MDVEAADVAQTDSVLALTDWKRVRPTDTLADAVRQAEKRLALNGRPNVARSAGPACINSVCSLS